MDVKSKAKRVVTRNDKEFWKKVQNSLDKMSDIVGSTLGPGGHVVLIERPGQSPLVTKDGVTVAKSIGFEDDIEHTVAEAAKEVCERTNKIAGDGTTTAIVLAHSLTTEGNRFLRNAPRYSPQRFSRTLDSIFEEIKHNVLSYSRDISSEEDLIAVANISANYETATARAVVDAITQVGEDGTVVVEEGNSRDTIVTLREGFPANKGLKHLGPAGLAFINDKPNQECVYNDCLVLLFDGELTDYQPLVPVIQDLHAAKVNKPLVVVAHKFSESVLSFLSINSAQGNFSFAALETPMSAQPNSKHLFLHDLAAFTAGRVFDKKITPISSLNIETDLGAIGRFKMGKYSTVFMDPIEEAEETIMRRVEELKGQLNQAESDFDAELVKNRIGTLTGGIAVISAGGSSDLEVRERKHRIEDAYNATRSAIEMGIIPGGGATLLRAVYKWYDSVNTPIYDALKEQGAYRLSILEALIAPFKRILANAGVHESEFEEIIEIIRSNDDSVYNALEHRIENAFESGVVDPVKVTLSALENAFSIAKMMMTLGGAITIPRNSVEEAKAEMEAAAIANQMGM